MPGKYFFSLSSIQNWEKSMLNEWVILLVCSSSLIDNTNSSKIISRNLNSVNLSMRSPVLFLAQSNCWWWKLQRLSQSTTTYFYNLFRTHPLSKYIISFHTYEPIFRVNACLSKLSFHILKISSFELDAVVIPSTLDKLFFQAFTSKELIFNPMKFILVIY